MDGTERITVLGIGNPLLRDEGVGVRVAEELMARYEFPERVTVLDAGTMGMAIMTLFRECDFMVVADAVDGTGHPPGTIVRMTPEQLAPNQVMHSLHDTRFVDVLQAAMLAGYDVRAEVVGVQVEDMEGVEPGLTPDVEAAVDSAVDAVLTILAERGVEPACRTAPNRDAQVLEAIRLGTEVPGPSDEPR